VEHCCPHPHSYAVRAKLLAPEISAHKALSVTKVSVLHHTLILLHFSHKEVSTFALHCLRADNRDSEGDIKYCAGEK